MWLPKGLARPVGTVWLLLLSCGVANAGWYLDKSCYDHGTEIQKVMQSSFEIADIMQKSIGRVSEVQKGTDDEKRVQEAEFNLLKYVFAETVKDGKVERDGQAFTDIETVLKDVLTFKEMKGVSASKNEDIINKKIADKKHETFEPAKNPPGTTLLTSSDFANINDVFIYCDFERFTPAGMDCSGNESKDAKGNKMMCNKNSLSNFTPSQVLMECMNQNTKSKPFHGLLTRNAAGHTYDAKGQRRNRPKAGRSSEIQFCAGYLDMFLKDNIKTIADEPKDPAGSKPESAWKSLVGKFIPGSQGSNKAPIDAFRTKDFNLFHELTHAPVGAGTIDVDGANSYYWNNVRRISDRKDADNTKKASYNADSFAFYAVGAWLISPEEGATPQQAMSDGSIEVLHPKGSDITKRNFVAPRGRKIEGVYTTMETIKTVITEVRTIPITVTPSDVGKPPVSSGSKSAPTTSAPITTGTQTTVVAVTSSDTTSSVTFVAAPLPSGKGKWGWRCKGALCNPKCPFPILCKGTGGDDGGGGGTWGLKDPWKPKPPPGGGPLPPDGPQPEPTPESKPDDDKPSNTKQNSESKRTSSKHTSSASSCKPTTTSTCDKIVSSYTKNNKVYTTTVDNKDKCKTVTKCSASLSAKTSTVSDAPGPTDTWTDTVDDVSDEDWENGRDKLLAAMIADKTDSTVYYAPGKTGSGSSSSSAAKPSHSTSSSSRAKPPNSKSSSQSHKTSPTSSKAGKPPTKSDTPTFKDESCGKDKSKVREHTDFVQDNVSLFDSFCKGVDTSKQHNSTVISTFGVVSFGYIPSKTKKQAFEYNCSDAMYSLSIGCADNNGLPDEFVYDSKDPNKDRVMKDTGEAVLDYGTYAYSIASIPTSVKKADTKPSASTAVPYATCNAKNTKVTGDVSEDRTGDISKACGNFFTVKDVKPGDKALHSLAESPKFDFYVQWVDGCKLPGGSQSQDPNSPLGGKCEAIFANIFDVCSADDKGNNGAGGAIQVGCLEYKATLSYTPPSPKTSSAPPKSKPTSKPECRVDTDDCVYSHPCYGGSTGPWCDGGTCVCG